MRKRTCIALMIWSGCAAAPTPSTPPLIEHSKTIGKQSATAQCEELAKDLECPAGTTRGALDEPHDDGMHCALFCHDDKGWQGPVRNVNLTTGVVELEVQMRNSLKHGVMTQSALHPETLETVRTAETRFVDNKMHGLHTEWFPSGRVRRTGNYIDDKKDGDWTTFAEDGEWVARRTFDRGTPIGVHEERYRNGQLASRRTYRADGAPDGEWCFWRSDGSEIACQIITDGTGVIVEYDRTGNVVRRTTIRQGRKHGLLTEYNFDGSRYESMYADGLQHGPETVYVGECPERITMWEFGQMEGPYREISCGQVPHIVVTEGELCRGVSCGRWTIRDPETGLVRQVIERDRTGQILGELIYNDAGELIELRGEITP